MRKIIRKSTVLLCFVCTAIFALIVAGNLCKPKQITFYDNNTKGEFFEIYKISLADSVKTAAVSKVSQENETAQISILGIIPVGKTEVTVAQRQYVNVGGSLIGIKLYTDGLLVVGVDDIISGGTAKSPAMQCGIKQGDRITQINDENVRTVAEFSSVVSSSDGNSISITVERDGKTLYFSLKPEYCENEDRYRCGLWLRDSTAGIGTLTFTDPQTSMFGALGHAICDSETKSVMSVADGDVLFASMSGCTKGEKGKTGQIKGNFVGTSAGELLANNDFGVYGTYSNDEFVCGKLYPVASQTEIEEGPAEIISTVSDDLCATYDIEIEKVSYSGLNSTRSIVIKVTDEELIEKTGGIIQGMSGSPIIQNGMLVGAVTHVFLNDPERGYGIFAETMLNEAQKIATSVK